MKKIIANHARTASGPAVTAACLLFLGAVVTPVRADAAGDSVDIPVTAMITDGSCEVTAKAGEDPTGAKGIENIFLDTESIFSLANGGVRGMTPLMVVLDGCGGALNNVAQYPTVTVSGDGTGYLFRSVGGNDNDSDARVGVVLSAVAPDGTGSASWTEANFIPVGGDIQMAAVTGALAVAGVSKEMWVGLSCGDLAMCNTLNDGPLSTGDITARLTFTFSYK